MNILNLFHATGLFLYPFKTWENQRFSYIFRGYKKRPVAWNGLINAHRRDSMNRYWISQHYHLNQKINSLFGFHWKIGDMITIRNQNSVCQIWSFKRQTQTIRGLLLTNCLSVFDHFVWLVLKGLKRLSSLIPWNSLKFFNEIYFGTNIGGSHFDKTFYVIQKGRGVIPPRFCFF